MIINLQFFPLKRSSVSIFDFAVSTKDVEFWNKQTNKGIRSERGFLLQVSRHSELTTWCSTYYRTPSIVISVRDQWKSWKKNRLFLWRKPRHLKNLNSIQVALYQNVAPNTTVLHTNWVPCLNEIKIIYLL